MPIPGGDMTTGALSATRTRWNPKRHPATQGTSAWSHGNNQMGIDGEEAEERATFLRLRLRMRYVRVPGSVFTLARSRSEVKGPP